MTQEEFISEFYSCDNEEEALKRLYSKLCCLKEENQQLKGSLQTHEILLRANVEENQKLKEQLIVYLEEKIKQCNKLLNKGNPKPYGEERNLYENSLLRYTEILNILKGGRLND